jgi:hypothetical protein
MSLLGVDLLGEIQHRGRAIVSHLLDQRRHRVVVAAKRAAFVGPVRLGLARLRRARFGTPRLGRSWLGHPRFVAARLGRRTPGPDAPLTYRPDTPGPTVRR